jgi:hypothetical protein
MHCIINFDSDSCDTFAMLKTYFFYFYSKLRGSDNFPFECILLLFVNKKIIFRNSNFNWVKINYPQKFIKSIYQKKAHHHTFRYFDILWTIMTSSPCWATPISMRFQCESFKLITYLFAAFNIYFKYKTFCQKTWYSL